MLPPLLNPVLLLSTSLLSLLSLLSTAPPLVSPSLASSLLVHSSSLTHTLAPQELQCQRMYSAVRVVDKNRRTQCSDIVSVTELIKLIIK